MIDINRTFVSPVRFFLLLLAVAAVFGVLAAQFVYLQHFKHAEYTSIARESRVALRIIPARRGDILDANGNLLATTRTLYDVGVDPSTVKDEDHAQINELAALLDIEIQPTIDAFKRRYFSRVVDGHETLSEVRWVKLAEGVGEETYEAVRALGIRAVYGNRRHARVYPSGALAAHVTGFRNQSGYALGVEHCMDYYLRGQDGWLEIERDGRRREIAQFRTRDVAPRNGLNVRLTLDGVIQHYVEEEIRRLADEYAPQGIAIIVSDPRTGALLALANYPAFDPNTYWEAEPGHFRNRALTDLYEPGSTFKIVPVAGALQKGLATPETEFDCDLPVVKYYDRTYRLPGDDHPIGVASVEEILFKSSNRGAAQLGIRLGRQGLYDITRAFGYGSRTNLFLTGEFKSLTDWDGATGEIRGILHKPNAWDGLTITRMPMGHAVSATPMQVHMAMNVIASGGLLHQPRIVDAVLDANSQPQLTFPAASPKRVLQKAVAERVAAILHKVVLPGGTAKRANVPNFGVAGKTGTSRKIIDGLYSNRAHVASFSGFLPAWEPRLVITVVVNEPKMQAGTGYGGLVAAPAFKTIAEKCIQYLGIEGGPPEEADLYAAFTREGNAAQ